MKKRTSPTRRSMNESKLIALDALIESNSIVAKSKSREELLAERAVELLGKVAAEQAVLDKLLAGACRAARLPLLSC